MGNTILMLTLVCACAVPSCGVSEAPVSDSDLGQQAQPLLPVGQVALTHQRSFAAKGSFLVTPRWSNAGDALLVSGWRGIGLHRLEVATGIVRVIDSSFRGRAGWNAAGEVTTDAPVDQTGARVLFDRKDLRVLHIPYDGTISAVTSQGTTELASFGAWGGSVSGDGQLVAYCTGHVPRAQLRVVRTSGELVFEGPGVYPAWLPDRVGLVYSVPEQVITAAGTEELGGAELFVVGAPSWLPAPLTSTPGVDEMEPAVSPAGDRIAYSDWKTGTLFVARIAEAGGAQ